MSLMYFVFIFLICSSIILRRRLPFLLKSATNSVVEGIGLSVLADAFLILSSSPQSVLAAPEKSHWLPDNEVSAFNFFALVIHIFLFFYITNIYIVSFLPSYQDQFRVFCQKTPLPSLWRNIF